MKRFLAAANVKQVVLKLSLMAIAATLMVACNRDTKNPAGQAPALPLTRTSSSVASSPEQRLADALANIWDLIGKTRDGERALSDWSLAQGGADSASRKARLPFKQAMRVLLGDGPSLPSDAPPLVPPSYESRLELVVALLEKERPESGKKWRDKTFDPVLLRWGRGLIGGWNSDPSTDGRPTDRPMTAEEANKAVVEFCGLAEKEFLEPGLKTMELETQIGDRAGPEVDRCIKEAFHVTLEQWLAGQGPADFDFVAAVRKLLVQYHPEIAGPMADFFAERISHEVHFSQNDVKNKLTDIANAEQSFVERMLGGKGDYWTPDLAGLYRHQPSNSPINLINPELARLDARPANFNNEAPLPPAPPPSDDNLPKFGFAAVRGADGAALDAHHYAFCAWPLGYRRIGRQTYLLVDPGKVFVKDTGGKPIDRLPADLEAEEWMSLDFNVPGAVPAAAASQPSPAAAPPESLLADPDPTVRIKGLNRLVGIQFEGDAVRSASPARQISPPAAKALAAMLGDKNEFVRRRARELTQFIGKPAIAEAKPVVMQCLKSDDDAIRSDAILAVKELKIRSEEFAAIVASLASATNPAERDAAFSALAIQQLDDETARRLVAQAGQAIQAENTGDVSGAMQFLGSRGPLATASAETLKQIGTTPDPQGGPYRQEDAAEAYFHISGDASVYADYLVGKLKTDGFDRELIYKLAAVGPPAADALPDLRNQLTIPNHDMVRPLIIYAIGRISGDLTGTVTQLIPMLKDDAQTSYALEVLEKLGPDAHAALTALQEQAATKTGVEREPFERTIAAVNGMPLEDN